MNYRDTAQVLRPGRYLLLNRKYVPYDVQGSYVRVLVEHRGFEPLRRKVAARLASQLDPLRLRSAQKTLRVLRSGVRNLRCMKYAAATKVTAAYLVEHRGFEPLTSRLRTWRSTN